MFDYSVHHGMLCDLYRNYSSQVFTLILIITAVNIATSITATLGNALILVALHKDSSLNPPSKLFLRCLAFSDLSVGLVVQPAAVVSLLSAVYQPWDLCHVSEGLWLFFSIFMVGFSFLTTIAISVDRLLALLLGIRYRQVVTIKRARFLVVMFLLPSSANYVTYSSRNVFAFAVFSGILWSSWLIVSTYCYARIYLTLQNYIQAQITPQGQPNGISPMNWLRYKKTVSTALWIFATMMICYLPFGLVVVSHTTESLSISLMIINYFAITLLYFNSSLNPVLYCWKIREVRNAVKEILRNVGFL